MAGLRSRFPLLDCFASQDPKQMQAAVTGQYRRYGAGRQTPSALGQNIRRISFPFSDVPPGAVDAQFVPCGDKGSTGHNLCAQRFHRLALRVLRARRIGVFHPRMIDQQLRRTGGNGGVSGFRFGARLLDGLLPHGRAAAGEHQDQAQAGGK